MALSFSTDTDTLTDGLGRTISADIQEYQVSGTPRSLCGSIMREALYNDERVIDAGNRRSPYYNTTYSSYFESLWLWENDNASRTPFQIGTISRVTSVDWATSAVNRSGLAFRDRNRVGYYAQTIAGGTHTFNQALHLVDATGATLLDDWFFPTPTHLLINGGANLNLAVMTGAEPTHPRIYLQPHVRGFSDLHTKGIIGIGGYTDGVGMRLLSNLPGQPWFIPGVPLLALLPFPVLQEWPATSFVHAAYGVTEVEVSFIGTYVTLNGSGGTVTGVDIIVTLTQTKEDGSTTDTDIATVATTLVSTEPYSNPAYTQYGFELQPTDSGHSATLDDDTLSWRISVRTSVTGSLFDVISEAPNYWHKVPCYILPQGLSMRASEEEVYLPGWLYDPNA